MKRPRTSCRERGTTLIEVLAAFAVLLIGIVAFIAAVNVAVRSTAFGHRTTTLAFLRSSVIDRMVVMPRAAIGALPTDIWVLDRCYDATAGQLDRNGAASWSSTFVCPANTMYQSWVRVTPHPAAPTPPVSWSVALYVERTTDKCSDASNPAAARHRSIACAAADLLLTD